MSKPSRKCTDNLNTMPAQKTVILGEASESDSDEASFDESQADSRIRNSVGTDRISRCESEQPNIENITNNATKGGFSRFGSSLIASISSTSSLVRLVNPSHLLASTGMQNESFKNDRFNDVASKSRHIEPNQLPLLHKTLYTKNQQFHACVTHLCRHPYEKASKDIHTINQRLVNAQKTIQELDGDVEKLIGLNFILNDLRLITIGS